MRDVTDKRTEELEVGEVKRGRGRPRKDDAMTSAQRQAAYRARLKADGISSHKPHNVPELQRPPIKKPIVHQVDAYDECRIEVDTLRSELDHADQIINDLINERDKLRAELSSAREAIDNYKIELFKIYHNPEKKAVTTKRVTKKTTVAKESSNSVTERPVTKILTKEEWPFPGDKY